MTEHLRVPNYGTEEKDTRKREIIHEIRTGVSNIELVHGREYRKYMVYALFDYVCQIKDELYVLGKKFGRQMDLQLANFIHEAQAHPDTDKTFLSHCLFYRGELYEYIHWAKSKRKN
jgi:hypothetical protein